MLKNWKNHTDLIAVEVKVVGVYRDGGGKIKKQKMGTISGTPRRFRGGNLGVHLDGKVPDLTPYGIVQGNTLRVSGNIWVPGSAEWEKNHEGRE